ncbi:hypothetical protein CAUPRSCDRAFT_11703 [Caulochytrium protostelioides]|uniref:Uncharacterized protein n=1 Tax=Caulochytrium protostelioides TaxID=1555241 RepID=A0A4P9WYL1_9FUNG|nr:hypothetical protein CAUPRSCDRAFT_11703 [Caulochytrium protostelioides]
MLAGEHKPLADDSGIDSDDLFDYDAYVGRLTPTPGGSSQSQLSHDMEISPGDPDIFPVQFLPGGHSEGYDKEVLENLRQQLITQNGVYINHHNLLNEATLCRRGSAASRDRTISAQRPPAPVLQHLGLKPQGL